MRDNNAQVIIPWSLQKRLRVLLKFWRKKVIEINRGIKLMQLLSSLDESLQRVGGIFFSQLHTPKCLRGVSQAEGAFTKAGDGLPLIYQGQQETPGFSGIVLSDTFSLSGC